jgi:hypothetical protein
MLGENRRPLTIDRLEATPPAANPGQEPGTALETIFAGLRSDPVGSARQTLGYFQAGGPEARFTALARRYILDRATGYHDYKLSEAVFESAAALPHPWRQRYLAANVPYLNGPADKPNALVANARALLR